MAIIALCGGEKCRDLVNSISHGLELRGHIVLAPPEFNLEAQCNRNCPQDEYLLLLWKGSTFAHFNRIKTANILVNINPGGYMSIDSTLQLGYAVSLGKLIISLRHDIYELSRESLFDVVLDCEDGSNVVNQLDRILSGKRIETT